MLFGNILHVAQTVAMGVPICLGGRGKPTAQVGRLGKGVANGENDGSAPLNSLQDDAPAALIRDLPAALDGVVHGVSEERAEIQRIQEIKQPAIQVGNAVDLLLSTDGELFAQNHIKHVAAGADLPAVGANALQKRSNCFLVLHAVCVGLQIEQEVFHVVVFPVQRIHVPKLLIEELLLAAQNRLHALLLLPLVFGGAVADHTGQGDDSGETAESDHDLTALVYLIDALPHIGAEKEKEQGDDHGENCMIAVELELVERGHRPAHQQCEETFKRGETQNKQQPQPHGTFVEIVQTPERAGHAADRGPDTAVDQQQNESQKAADLPACPAP